MKYVKTLVFFSIVAVCYAAPTASKDDLSRELVHVYGIDQMIGDAKQAAEAQARAAAEQMFAQYKAGMPGLNDSFWSRITQAADRMIATVQKSWTAEEAIDVWRAEYCTDLTVDELRQIIDTSKTPIGQKQIAAGKRANVAFQQFYVTRSRDVIQQAMKQYVEELQKIAADAMRVSK